MQESVEGVPNPACSPSVRCFRVQVTTWKISAKQISLRIVGRRRSLTPAGSARLVGTKVSFCLRRRRRQKKKSKLNSGYAKTSKYCRGTYCVNRETLTPLFFFFSPVSPSARYQYQSQPNNGTQKNCPHVGHPIFCRRVVWNGP